MWRNPRFPLAKKCLVWQAISRIVFLQNEGRIEGRRRKKIEMGNSSNIEIKYYKVILILIQ